MNNIYSFENGIYNLSDSFSIVLISSLAKEGRCYEDEINNIKNNKVDERTFRIAIDKLYYTCDFLSDFYSDGKNSNYESDMFEDLQNVIKEYEEIKSRRMLKEEKKELLLPVAQKLIEQNKLMHLVRDLNHARKSHIIDLEYFKSKEDINKWDKEFETAYNNRDVKKMKGLLYSVQEEILEEWKKTVNDSNKDDFEFIGHSTFSTKFTDGFYDKYVSCSFFNKEFNSCYNGRFGLIMSPKDIIGADSRDMYIYNNSFDNENLLAYSSVPILHHPKRILKEMKEHREENEEKKKSAKIYSEVVINGFKPIGIFCFTTGAKEYDRDYIKALELKNNYPNLPFKLIDIFDYKVGIEADKFKLNLLKTLNGENTNDPEKYMPSNILKEEDIPLFEMFFKEFKELKKHEDYTKDDIKDIFDKNVNLLKQDNYTLFKSNLSDEDIKYSLDYGYNFNIKRILEGNCEPWNINKLKNLYNDRDKLNKFYPGLSELVLMLNKTSIDDELFEEIKKDGNISFTSIAKKLSIKVMNIIEEEEKTINASLQDKYRRREELIKENEELDEYEAKHNKYSIILYSKYYLHFIEKELNSVNDEYKFVDNRVKFREEEMIIKKNDANKLQEEINFYEENYYSNSDECKKMNDDLDDLKMDLENLKKHPFVNFRKISIAKKHIKSIIYTINKKSLEFDEKGKEIIDSNTEKLKPINEEINKIEKDIDRLKEHKKVLERSREDKLTVIKEEFGCETIEEAKLLIEEATEFERKYSNTLLIKFNNENELEELNKIIKNKEEKLGIISEDKRNISIAI